MEPWKRPESPQYPHIWAEFTAQGVESNEIVKYWIQDLPEDRFEDAVQHMLENYLDEETIAASLGMLDDPVSVEENKMFWRYAMSSKQVIACFRENSNDIVAVNLLMVKDGSEHEIAIKGTALNDLFRLMFSYADKFSLYEKYGITKYLDGFGLGVSKKYRSRGIATEMLKARLAIVNEFNLNLSTDMFTSPGSQTAADKAGYKLDFEITYKELRSNGFPLSGVRYKSIKHMSLLGDQMKDKKSEK